MTLSKYLADLWTFPRDSARAWRAGGLVAVRDEIRKRTLDRVGGYVRRYVIEADLSRLAEVAPPEGVEIRPFDGPDWSLLGDMSRDRLTGRFERAAAAGRVCLVAWQRRQAVGFAWFSPRIEIPHESYDLPLPADTIYIWQIEVCRSERRRGVAAALLSSGLQLSRDRGFHRAWIIIHPANVASLRTMASVAPSRVLGTVARLKVLSWIYSRYQALSAPVQLEGILSR
jgi:GNAT superfamily N-acetyltransferase